jgi:hypothetical protein
MIGQTYSGASGMKGHVTGLEKKGLSSCPNAYLTHCYAHSINLLLQSLAILKERKNLNFKCVVNFFFLNLSKEYKPFMHLC